ncbi:hypothetical protein ACVW00_003505 [Marmoricola sp. URHA0025 HA25]
MESPIDVLARTAGGLLSSGAVALGAARDRTKPLHPDGQVRRATLTRIGGGALTGVPWLDEPGRDDALARLSRGVGLPGPLPDVQGLAIRVQTGDRPADVLLASTGLGRLTRYLLTPTWRTSGRPLTSLLPYRSPRGPLLLAAVPGSTPSFDLRWAGPVGPWVSFGTLELGEPLGDDRRLSFDRLVNVVPGLGSYGWVERLREPAYLVARRRTHRTTSHA